MVKSGLEKRTAVAREGLAAEDGLLPVSTFAHLAKYAYVRENDEMNTSVYDVYLEVGPGGECMAHVPALPGCMVRTSDEKGALAASQTAVADYFLWLQTHGEPADEPPSSFQLQVAGVVRGRGPFVPGDTAALFEPDHQPLSRDEMEAAYLRRAAYSRADLLRLVTPLSEQMLAWQPDADSMGIDRILRHIGNAEEWYVSRLVDPATLPAEWVDDERLPTFEFLAMSRATAVDRLRQLTGEELAYVTIPASRGNTGEPWTARKALRRLLEHEREHMAHIREVLAAWRSQILARLDGERSELLRSVLSLSEATLTMVPVFDDWTARDILAHIARWDRFHNERLSLILNGRSHEIQAIESAAAFNQATHPQDQALSLEAALALLLKERSAFLATLSRVTDEELHQAQTLPPDDTVYPHRWVELRARHDAGHVEDLRRWRRRLPEAGWISGTSPAYLMRAALRASRKAFLSLTALVPAAERTTRPVCGVWTLKDLLGHLADWEMFAVEGLRQISANGRIVDLSYGDSIQAWNDAHAAARQEQRWSQVWNDFHQVRREMLDIIDQMDQATFLRQFETTWRQNSAYAWMFIWLDHEREHSAWLRQELALEA